MRHAADGLAILQRGRSECGQGRRLAIDLAGIHRRDGQRRRRDRQRTVDIGDRVVRRRKGAAAGRARHDGIRAGNRRRRCRTDARFRHIAHRFAIFRAGIRECRQHRRLAIDLAGVGGRDDQRGWRDAGGRGGAGVDRIVAGVGARQAQAVSQYRLVVADIRVKKGGRTTGIADGGGIGRQYAAEAAAGELGVAVAVIHLVAGAHSAQ